MLGSLLHPLALTSTALLKNLASLALVVTSATYCSALVVFRKVPMSAYVLPPRTPFHPTLPILSYHVQILKKLPLKCFRIASE
jgi:hypothetical protein